MIIRVRSNVGVWRAEIEDSISTTATPQDVVQVIAQRRPHVVYEQPLSSDPACKSPLNMDQPLTQQGLRHGSMIHCRVDASTCVDVSQPPVEVAATTTTASNDTGNNENTTSQNASSSSSQNMKRIVAADGTIKLIPSTEAATATDKGFRKGMMALRDIKKSWTLNEFVAMDAQFEFKLKRQEESICRQVSLDIPSVSDFQAYLQRFQFQRKRYGILYGKFVKDNDSNNSDDKDNKNKNKAIVEAIYEPPQQPDPDAAEGFEQLDDPLEETVEHIAGLCGLQKVGWIFGHAPRDVVMNAAEILMTAEYQLEAAGGVEETPFVTVKVTRGDDGNVSVEAFQVSQQCMAMVAEEALELSTDESVCQVNETFTAIQEGKESKTVDNSFFLTVVPIVQHTSETFVAQFPRMNRDLDDRTPSKDELKRQLSKSGSQGWTFMDLLSDFNLLIYASTFLDIHADYPKICQSVVNREIPLDDGYKIIIASVAGLDNAY